MDLINTVDVGSKKYYEYTAALRGIDSELRNTDKSLVQLQKDRNNIPLQNLEWAGDELDRRRQQIENNVSLKEAKGDFVSSNDYNDLIANGIDRINNIIQRHAIIRNLQVEMDVNSSEYQKLQQELANNESEIQSIQKRNIKIYSPYKTII